MGFYKDQDKWNDVEKIRQFAEINDEYDKLLEKNVSDEELEAWEKSVEQQYHSQTAYTSPFPNFNLFNGNHYKSDEIDVESLWQVQPDIKN